MSTFEPPLNGPIVNQSGHTFGTWRMWFINTWNDVVLNNAFRLRSTIRISDTDSPYTMVSTIKNLFCDTDGGAITVLLEAGVNGTKHKIVNTGTSGNNVTITPNGTELLFQVNGSEPLYDQEQLDLDFETTENWT